MFHRKATQDNQRLNILQENVFKTTFNCSDLTKPTLFVMALSYVQKWVFFLKACCVCYPCQSSNSDLDSFRKFRRGLGKPVIAAAVLRAENQVYHYTSLLLYEQFTGFSILIKMIYSFSSLSWKVAAGILVFHAKSGEILYFVASKFTRVND